VSSDYFKPSDVYGFQDELEQQTDEFVEGIRVKFCEWVDEIDVSSVSPSIAFDPYARFLTFNYTPTLQRVYGIEDKRILHIHGQAGVDTLVFGHGIELVEEPEFDPETGESNRTIFTDAEGFAKYPLYAFKKQVEEIIKRNQSYFVSLRDVSEVVIIGHSLNDVDLPYFREIASYARSCKWVVSCHEESDWKHHPSQLASCGISREMIFTRPY
jgi:hypothetical protein